MPQRLTNVFHHKDKAFPHSVSWVITVNSHACPHSSLTNSIEPEADPPLHFAFFTPSKLFYKIFPLFVDFTLCSLPKNPTRSESPFHLCRISVRQILPWRQRGFLICTVFPLIPASFSSAVWAGRLLAHSFCRVYIYIYIYIHTYTHRVKKANPSTTDCGALMIPSVAAVNVKQQIMF